MPTAEATSEQIGTATSVAGKRDLGISTFEQAQEYQSRHSVLCSDDLPRAFSFAVPISDARGANKPENADVRTSIVYEHIRSATVLPDSRL
jgi:hypothetical protein